MRNHMSRDSVLHLRQSLVLSVSCLAFIIFCLQINFVLSILLLKSAINYDHFIWCPLLYFDMAHISHLKPRKNLVIFVAHRHPGPLSPNHLAKFKWPRIIQEWQCLAHYIFFQIIHIEQKWYVQGICIHSYAVSSCHFLPRASPRIHLELGVLIRCTYTKAVELVVHL